MSVELEFVGHACFRLWEDGRPTIVMDPYAPWKANLPEDGFQLDGQTVIVSSLTDPAHDNVKLVRGDPRVINALDVATGKAAAQVNGQPLVTIAAAEIPDHPEGTDDNALYAFKAGGQWFAHMGDLGFELGKEELRAFVGKCDVFMVITGEKFTPKFAALDQMIDFLGPKWIVPMHYCIPPLGAPGEPGGGMTAIDAFLNHRSADPVYVCRSTKVGFPLPGGEAGRPTIVVIEPAGYEPTGGLVRFAVT